MLEQRGKVCGSIEAHMVDCIHVGFHELLESLNFGRGRVVVDWKAMVHLVLVYSLESRNSSEPESRNSFVRVIVLYDIPDTLDAELVLGRLLHYVMQRVRILLRVPI